MYYNDNRNDQVFKEAQRAYDYTHEPEDEGEGENLNQDVENWDRVIGWIEGENK